ncbi:hypothetical protein UFOVP98_39 [uncultured Caudovirales phage]|uniref:Uncharacterized protein n=1 Tax=uncultured Caudovirales phage TaxID=2100421 RepID=A0A6J5L082_9CAUD|nr:hypothetical protein UFOVP98_39 [uncultured Caudovirales phage]CAB4134280.1 hypothetical protein UFOVP269_31 [uncultured Caudovirales phage]
MIPKIEDYKILYLQHMFFVLEPYDLYLYPVVQISGKGYDTKDEAEQRRQELFKFDMNEYERLKKLGRSFPDND